MVTKYTVKTIYIYPFWANIYLYWYENKFMCILIRTDKRKAFLFNGNYRFIDDLIILNGGSAFLENFRDIYPGNLELKLEHTGSQATFLDLEIVILDGKFYFKLFDKRDNFPFHIVRMPYFDSNIPEFTFYGSVFSEFLRIARCSMCVDSFISTAHKLYSRMIRQGGNEHKILNLLDKLYERFPYEINKYNKSIAEIKKMIKRGPIGNHE